jgi:hypothetical protein
MDISILSIISQNEKTGPRSPELVRPEAGIALFAGDQRCADCPDLKQQ